MVQDSSRVGVLPERSFICHCFARNLDRVALYLPQAQGNNHHQRLWRSLCIALQTPEVLHQVLPILGAVQLQVSKKQVFPPADPELFGAL